MAAVAEGPPTALQFLGPGSGAQEQAQTLLVTASSLTAAAHTPLYVPKKHRLMMTLW
jgi:hypothetical protein